MEPMDFDEPSMSRASSMSFHNSLYYGSSSSSYDDAMPSTSRDQTLDEILADLPDDILTGCGPDEVFREDYRDVLFPRERPEGVPFTEPTQSAFHEEEVLDPEDCFYFESEHLALKGNKDYHELLGTIVILHAQRTQAIKDLDELLLAKRKALEDPVAYVAKLQNGDLPEYPGAQKIPELPKIDWAKYKVSHADNYIRPQTRHAKNPPPVVEAKGPEVTEDKILVRGRVYDESKPETFNQRWTNEEQVRLEALLRKYPPEEVAMNRYTKIANELGNRTPKQVSSRVQKYYIKLKKAGITTNEYYIKSTSNVRKSTKRTVKSTTFFPYNQEFTDVREDPAHDDSDESQTSSSFAPQYNADMKQIQLLKKTKGEKDSYKDGPVYIHLGHKCQICNQEPIKHVRWHCEDCYDLHSKNVDLCTDCAYTQINLEKPQHPINHRLTRIEPSKSSNSCLDSAYHAQNFNDEKINYLDTNYGLE